MRTFFSMLLMSGLLGVLTLNSCGAPEAPTTDASNSDSNTPYPGFRGQEFRGEKNFAHLINNYLEGKSVPTPWAGY
jgi:hypothetical protein